MKLTKKQQKELQKIRDELNLDDIPYEIRGSISKKKFIEMERFNGNHIINKKDLEDFEFNFN